MGRTIFDLLARHDVHARAIGAPDREWLTYGGLRRLSADVSARLHEIGIGRGDRVAIVLPNGPEMACAFITIVQVATAAPLNPSYRQDEYEFYLKDLSAKAVVLSKDYDGPAVTAAETLGVAVVRLDFDPSGQAGTFTLSTSARLSAGDRSAPEDEDVALILHTSGTTSRPKIVPLLQSNIFASAHNIRNSLALTSADRCLNIMPLFHIHGLMAAVTASLAAGAHICCTPGFNALRFFAQLEAIRPTWYTAVPTMHQAILTRAERNSATLEKTKLRFLRSSSSSLPAPVMAKLIKTFGAPVVEAYGMTEATHQMCSNPLPAGSQKPGSVGLPAGPEVRIANETDNALLPAGAIGEVVISGPNVTPGYEANEKANAAAFFVVAGQRWFRTGDQGRFDADGYLSLTGRLKEIINRGGEKISPIEVDAVLLNHPEIEQACCFVVPHEKLGEDIAAAVVLREGSGLDAKAIRAFAAGHLADFKVPRSVVILDEIPKGATGKIQRIGMAERLGLEG